MHEKDHRRKGERDAYKLLDAGFIAAPIAFAALFLLAHAPTPLLAQERAPIIDMHLHGDLPPEQIRADAPALCRPACRGEGGATSGHAETLERTLQAMKRFNIVKGFVSGLDREIVQKCAQAAPDRIIGSVLSIGSSTSVLSIGSSRTILSIGGSGAFLHLRSWRSATRELPTRNQ